MYKKLKPSLLIFIVWLLSTQQLPASGNIAIVTASGQAPALSRDGLRGLFLGRTLISNDGETLYPVFLLENDVHDAFLKSFLKRTANQLNSHWAIRIFTGKSSPPISVNNAAEMQKFLAENKNYIGYLSADSIDENLQVIELLAAD